MLPEMINDCNVLQFGVRVVIEKSAVKLKESQKRRAIHHLRYDARFLRGVLWKVASRFRLRSHCVNFLRNQQVL